MADRAPIVRFYDRWAGPYDLLGAAPIVRRWRARAIDPLELQTGDVVVEMGCGTGTNLPLLRDRVGQEGRVVGLDLSPGMLERGRVRVRRAGWDNVELLRGDATDPPIDDADVIFASFVVGLFAEPATTVSAWMELLAPDGRIALLDAVPSSHPLGAPANLGFRTFVRLTAPSSRTSPASPARRLKERVRAAHEQVAGRTADPTRETFAVGFLRVTGGRIG